MPTRTKRSVTMSAEQESPLQAPSSPLETPEPLAGDIDDPNVPEGTTEALEAFIATPEDVFMSRGQGTVPDIPEGLLPLAHGFCQFLQARLDKELTDAGIRMARGADTTITAMADYTKGVLAANEHANYSFAEALVQFARGNPTLPYQLALQVHTPQGFPLTVTVQKQTAEELIPAMVKLGEWMSTHGYTP